VLPHKHTHSLQLDVDGSRLAVTTLFFVELVNLEAEAKLYRIVIVLPERMSRLGKGGSIGRSQEIGDGPR